MAIKTDYMTLKEKPIVRNVNIEDKIVYILKHGFTHAFYPAIAIKSLLKQQGLETTYDTLSKHLKSMTERGLLTREAKGKPWMYYYEIK